jgi:putative ABC transport system permease protein
VSLAAYVLANLRRNPLRTSLTVLGVAVAVLLFCALDALLAAFRSGAEAADASRVIVRNRVSLVQPLPLAYVEHVRGVEGVADVTWSNWFGGRYEARRGLFFPQFAVDPESYLRVHPEFVLAEAEREAFLRDRAGCVLGRRLAARLGKRVGDRIVLAGTIYPGRWEFDVRGIYAGAAEDTNESLMLFHWRYLEERREAWRKGQVGALSVRVADPAQAAAVMARIDARFENSAFETLTETERQFQLGFVSMLGNVAFFLRAIGAAVVFTILMVAANTMMMAARERASEFATLKTIGFPGRTLFALLLGESAAIGLVGGVAGAAVAYLAFGARVNLVSQFLSGFRMQPGILLEGLALALGAGLLSGIAPAWSAARLRVAQAMGRP